MSLSVEDLACLSLGGGGGGGRVGVELRVARRWEEEEEEEEEELVVVAVAEVVVVTLVSVLLLSFSSPPAIFFSVCVNVNVEVSVVWLFYSIEVWSVAGYGTLLAGWHLSALLPFLTCG
jgi:hypothetical protein